MRKMSSWRRKSVSISEIFPSQNIAKNVGRSSTNAGMLESSKNAGFPARLRDG